MTTDHVIILVATIGGIAGAVIGTRGSLKAAVCAEERRFILRGSIIMSAGCAVFLAALLCTRFFLRPRNQEFVRSIIWVLYVLAHCWTLRYVNRRTKQIRDQHAIASASGHNEHENA